jgi:periplasmic protein TonB
MKPEAVPVRGALWAQPEDVSEQTLPFWRAVLIALGIEIIVPFLVFGVDWSFLPSWEDPPPVPVMSVRLEQPPQAMPPPPPPEPEKKKKEKKPPEPKKLDDTRQVPVEPPKPLPNEVPSNIALPEPEPKPKPKPKPEPEVQEPEPEPEVPPLPSVFRDVKPVKKVRPKYPREAEDQKIEGRVKVRLKVELDGTVSNVEVLLAEPPGVFDDAVLEAVRQYVFKKDGTSYFANQEVIFKIDP